MTSLQLELLITYISNEIQIQALRGSGMSWVEQSNARESLITELRERVAENAKPAIKPKTNSPHDDPNHKFSPLMIDMLMFASHSGHRFYMFPNLSCKAQQQALEYFVCEDILFISNTFEHVNRFVVKLTPKGSALVSKILNTSVD